MKHEYVCQSCGARINKPEEFGTHGDGHINEDFCINCFKNGLFTFENIEDLCHEKDCDEKKLLGLKRRLDPLAQASWILDKYGGRIRNLVIRREKSWSPDYCRKSGPLRKKASERGTMQICC